MNLFRFVENIWLCNAPIKSKLQHPPRASPGHLNFLRLDRSNSHPLRAKMVLKCPTLSSHFVCQMPHVMNNRRWLLSSVVMHRSNRNFNVFPPPGKPRAFDYFVCPGSGEFDLYLGGVGKIEPEVSGLKLFSFSGAEVTNSYNNVFGRDGRV